MLTPSFESRRAVILAAGLGNRIAKVHHDIPKPLLPLDGIPGGYTFLDWHAVALDRAGFNDIYFVGNERTYQTPLRVQKEGRLTHAKIHWVLNPTQDLSTSGSGHSAQFAFVAHPELLSGESRTVLMDADIIYDLRVFSVLMQSERRDTVKTLVCPDYRDSQEEVMVFAGQGDAPVFHGKGLLNQPFMAPYSIAGEATGILLFEPKVQAFVKQVYEWTLRFSTAKLRSEHEDMSARLFAVGLGQIVNLPEEILFMECDTPEEYQELKSHIYPKLRSKIFGADHALAQGEE